MNVVGWYVVDGVPEFESPLLWPAVRSGAEVLGVE